MPIKMDEEIRFGPVPTIFPVDFSKATIDAHVHQTKYDSWIFIFV